jgi:DNA-directed RNA polymerase subunit RPC12/RpoP
MEKQPLHFWLPKWLVSSTVGRQCSQCGKKIGRDDISAVGIRKNDQKSALTVEYICPKCGRATALTFDQAETLEGLCYTLIRQIQKKKTLLLSKHMVAEVGPPINDDEVDRLKTLVRESKTHEEFMREIGASKYDTRTGEA